VTDVTNPVSPDHIESFGVTGAWDVAVSADGRLAVVVGVDANRYHSEIVSGSAVTGADAAERY
jgi:hypothetical protein